MHTKDLVIDDHAEGEKVKEISEVVPDVGRAVLALALRVEAIGLRDAACFVVSANQGHPAGVAELEADEQGDGFHAKEAAVDIITCEQALMSIWIS